MGESGGERGRWVIAVVVVVSVLVAATGGWIVGRVTGSAAAASVTLVPADTPGPDPFTRSVAIGEATAFPADVQAVTKNFAHSLTTDASTRTLVAVGTTPGLYGGSGDTRTCNVEQLVAFLRANSAKARAWAQVFGIPPSGIASYVAGLTPVVLTQDTLVTNHGYRDGSANAFQAVLQAGTAVLVDATGTPRVKCNCGNPLSPPSSISLADTRTVGRAWDGYTPSNVTSISQGTATRTFTLVNTTTGGTFTTGAGTTTQEGDGGSNDHGGGGNTTYVVTSVNVTSPCTSRPRTLDDARITVFSSGRARITTPADTYRGKSERDGTSFGLALFSSDHDEFLRVSDVRIGDGTISGTWFTITPGAETPCYGSGSFAGRRAGDAEAPTTRDEPKAVAIRTPGAPCTKRALQDAFSDDPENEMDTAMLDSPDQLRCVDGWAVLHYVNQGFIPAVVFRTTPSGWEVVGSRYPPGVPPGIDPSVAAACSSGSVPAQLRAAACG
jgi:hypothetical protein